MYFFRDSTINIAQREWKAKSYRKLVNERLTYLDTLRRLVAISFYWVPAHSEIFEHAYEADHLVKRGAEESHLQRHLLMLYSNRLETTAM